MRDALKLLCAAGGPSGFERPVAQIAAELLRPLVDKVHTDRLGNVIGVKRCGKPDARRLVLDAHLDEIGLIVTKLEDGFLRFTSIGGVDPRILPNREVTVLTEPPISGVITCSPPHLTKAEDHGKSIPMDELYIDVGLSQEHAQAVISPGTPIVYRESCFVLSENQMCGKAMDDRACFVSLLRTAELLCNTQLDVDLYILGSTFEEVGGAGAKTGVFAIEPDWCIAVDVTHGRTPDGPKDKTFKLGEGPAIGLGPNMTRWMSDRLKEKAEQKNIPVQLEVIGGHSGTNAWPIQISREGVATAVLSLPLKYMHTPVEVFDWSDLEQTAQLLAAFAVDLGKEGRTC